MKVWMYTIFIVILHSEQILSFRDLPKGAKIVERCPEPKNKTAWETASKTLGCSHSGKILPKQSEDYHCLPNSLLNEYVEFCGITARMDQGNCPVFHYVNTAGKNRSPSSWKCSTFSTGCPAEFYYSRDVYMYPECLKLYKGYNCFRADTTCRPHVYSMGFLISIEIVICVLVAIIFILIYRLRVQKNRIKRKNEGDGWQGASPLEDLEKNHQAVEQGIIDCVESNTMNKNNFREYCAMYLGKHTIRWHEKDETWNLKKVCLIVPSGGSRIADNIEEALEDFKPYTYEKKVMLIVMSFCLKVNRNDPPNILHEYQKPTSVDSFTNIIFDEEERFYPCIKNNIAAYDIEEFINS